MGLIRGDEDMQTSRLQPVWGWLNSCKSLEALEELLGVSHSLGAGVSTGWETRLGVGEGRKVGQGGQTSKVIPARGRVPLWDGA